MSEMKTIAVKINAEDLKTLKHVGIERNMSVGQLVVEAARKGDPDTFGSLSTGAEKTAEKAVEA